MYARIILKSGVSFVVEVDYLTHTAGAHGIIPDRMRWKSPDGASAALEHVDLDEVAAIIKSDHAERLDVTALPVQAGAQS